MSQSIDLNQNIAQCLEHIQHWGNTTIFNICTEKVTVVAWGPFDYIVAVGLTAVGVSLAVTAVLGLLFFLTGVVQDAFL